MTHLNRTRNLTLYLLLGAIVLAAFAIRVYRLDAVPLRGDEAYSVVHWTATPFTDRWEQLWRDEPAPVGAFTMYWLWTGLAGDSEFATRYLSLLGSVVGAAVVMALARRFFQSWRLAAFAGLMWVAHPFLIWHAQDARVYGTLAALSPLAFYWLLRALDAEEAHQSNGFWRTWGPYIGLQTAALYIYYLEPFWLVVQGLYVLLLMDRRLLLRAIRAWLVIGVLLIPVLAQLYTLMFVSEYQGNAESAGAVLLFEWFVPTLLFGENRWNVGAGLLVAGLILAGLVVYMRRNNPRVGRLLLLWILVPVVLLYGASFVSSFFRPRYVQTIIPALILALVACGVVIRAWLPGVTLRRVAPGMLTVGFLLIAAVEVRDYFFVAPSKSPDWPSLIAYLEPRLDDDTTVIFDTPDPGIEYYFPDRGHPLILPFGFYDIDWQPIIDRLLDEPGERVYLLNGLLSGEVGAYLQASVQHIPGDTRPNVVHYRSWQVDSAEIAVSSEATFPDLAIFRGYSLLPDATAILLYWEPLAQADRDYSILLHLEHAETGAVVVLDHPLAAWQISMQTWEPGRLYRDPVALPPDLPPGDYTIRVGLYDQSPENAVRIDGVADDSWAAGDMTVD